MAMKGAVYDALVKLMRGSPQSAANRAARRVLVDGITQADAVRETGATRSTVSDAVSSLTVRAIRRLKTNCPRLKSERKTGYERTSSEGV